MNISPTFWFRHKDSFKISNLITKMNEFHIKVLSLSCLFLRAEEGMQLIVSLAV